MPPMAAAKEHLIGSVIGTDMRIGIVVARFNELVTRLLLAGALESLGRHGVADQNVQVDSLFHIFKPDDQDPEGCVAQQCGGG